MIIEVEELVDWKIERTPLFKIVGKLSQVGEEELEVKLIVIMNCIIASDYEKGSRKLAVPLQIILPS